MSSGLKQYTFITTFLFMGIAIGKFLPIGGIKTVIGMLVVLWFYDFAEDNFKGGRHAKWNSIWYVPI